jgi:hypothetical protein
VVWVVPSVAWVLVNGRSWVFSCRRTFPYLSLFPKNSHANGCLRLFSGGRAMARPYNVGICVFASSRIGVEDFSLSPNSSANSSSVAGANNPRKLRLAW